MAGQDLNHWVKVEVTLKHKQTLATKTIAFTNRAEIQSADIDNDHWPLLESISRIGMASDRESVLPQAGSFRIYNYLGSFGVERKFTDLLQRYVIIDQPVTVQYAKTAAGDFAPSSYTTYFTGKVLNWRASVDDQSPTVDINFDARPFEKKFIGKKITPDDFADAPTSSLWRTLPLVISNGEVPIQVRPILISETVGNLVNTTTAIYAYATTLGTQFVNGGIQEIYAKDYDGIFREIQSPATVGTYVLENTTTITGAQEINQWELACLINHDPTTDNYLITHVDITFDGRGVPRTHDGEITVTIYEGFGDGGNQGPGRALVKAIRQTADHDTDFDGPDDFAVRFAFEKPLVMAGSKGYWIGIRHIEDVGTTEVYVRNNFASAANAWRRPDGTQWIQTSNTTLIAYQFLAAKFTDTATPSSNEINADGWGHSYFTITENTTKSGWEEPDITEPEYILGIDGLLDDTSGTITGLTSEPIGYTHDAINILQYEWNGSTWADSGKWDFNAYSDTHDGAKYGQYLRRIAGASAGNLTIERLFRDWCKNSGFKIVLRKNGKLALWAWGLPQSTILELHQENSKLLNYNELDTSYVLNRVRVAALLSLTESNTLDIIVEGIPGQYQLIRDWSVSSNPIAGEVTGYSVDVFGERINQEQIFNWIGDVDSAAVMQRYLLTSYAYPPIYVSIQTEIEQAANIEPMVVVGIKTPNLPAFYGTSAKARTPTLDGEEIDLAANLTRAERYRGQVEAMYIDFATDETPRLILNCRLLLNSEDPT